MVAICEQLYPVDHRTHLPATPAGNRVSPAVRLAPEIRDRTTLHRGKRGKQIRHQSLKVDQPVGSGSNYDDGDFKGWKILLKREIAIDGDEDLKLLRCKRKQFSVL